MLSDFLEGLRDIRRGAAYLGANRSLWHFIFIPTLINIALGILSVYFLANYYGSLMETLTRPLSQIGVEHASWWASIVSGLLWMLRGFVRVLLGLVLIVVLVIVMLFISQIVNSPFYDWLSEAIEARMGLAKAHTQSGFKFMMVHAGKTVWLEIKKLLFFINVPLVLLLLNLIPVAGALLYTALTNLFAAWDLGFNFISYPMSRRLMPFRSQILFAARHKARLMGLGAPVMIPFINLLLAPVFVVAGTLAYIELSELLPSRKSSSTLS